MRLLFAATLVLFACSRAHTGDDPHRLDALEIVQAGHSQQWVLMRGDAAKPVLLILHGGPGAASIGFARAFYSGLEKDFLVVNWDQRGAGKSFFASLAGATPETFVSDTDDVVEFLRNRFSQKRIFLMGHSWGGYVAARYAHEHPEKLEALILIGPVVSGEQSARISLEEVRRRAPETLADRARRLTMDDYLRERRFWLNQVRGGMFYGPTRLREDAFFRGLMWDSPDYSLLDMLLYVPGIWKSSNAIRPFFFQMNLFEQAPEIRVPVIFASGRFDLYNPPEILERYAASVRTPHHEILWFENCAHAPHFEEPVSFAERLRSALVPGLRTAALRAAP